MGFCCGSTPSRGELVDNHLGTHNAIDKNKPLIGNWIGHKDKKLKKDYHVADTTLGVGAYGEVRECTHKVTKAKRAVKILKKQRLDEQEKNRMMNEINNLKMLDHPNIMRMYESYECEKRYYIVTDLAKGGELFDDIAKNKFFSESNA